MLLSGTVPFSVVTSSAEVDESTVTLVDLGGDQRGERLAGQAVGRGRGDRVLPGWRGRAGAGGAVPGEIREARGRGCDLEGVDERALALVTVTVTLLAPDGTDTAPVTEPPLVSSVAVVLGASTVWPSMEAPLAICVDCRLVCRLVSELCMDCMLDTSLICSSWLRNWVGSVGCSGF